MFHAKAFFIPHSFKVKGHMIGCVLFIVYKEKDTE